MSVPVDLDQLAALRALRRGFGDVQVLEDQELTGRPRPLAHETRD
jgi:hypothetical protein